MVMIHQMIDCISLFCDFVDCDVENIAVHIKRYPEYTVLYQPEYNTNWIHGKKPFVSRNKTEKVIFPQSNGLPFENSWLWKVSTNSFVNCYRHTKFSTLSRIG